MSRNLIRLIPSFLPLLLLACGAREFTTPLEEAEGDVLTSYEDMVSFFQTLQAETEAFSMDTIGSSVEGRNLFLLRFDDPYEGEESADEKLKVLIYAQQHGNEPSGKEAAIALTRDIATGIFREFLREVDFYLIPQVNPDGSEMRQRRNADDVDLNRDHLTLSTPEVSALHGVFNELFPEVTLDVHEYGPAGSAWVEAGFHKDFGQQIGALSNPNMSMDLRQYAWDRVIPEMKESLEDRDVFLRRYLVTDGPEARFRYSTTALNDGRNSMGIYNSLSFLIEGRNGVTVEEEIRERTRQQLETMKAFLTFFQEHADPVREMVARERDALRSLDTDVALVMDYVPDPVRPEVTVGVIDLETGGKRDLVIEAFHPMVEATLFVSRPMGYAIPSLQTDVLEVLEKHGIEMTPAEAPTPALLESYRIEEVTESTKEDKDFLDVDVTVTREESAVPAGDVIVWCNQVASNLIVSLLEPQSQWGLAPLPPFDRLLMEGSEYPVKRIVELPD